MVWCFPLVPQLKDELVAAHGGILFVEQRFPVIFGDLSA